jgi:DNA-binding PadR family transcriptional regulator
MVYFTYVIYMQYTAVYNSKGLSMRKMSNVEIALLQIIAGQKEISGYGISRIVKERGYREWADIGMTSIYGGLKKLEEKELVTSRIHTDKQGKGPTPTIYGLTTKGRQVLQREVLSLLSQSRERERVFDLGVAGIPFVPSKKVVEALSKRKEYLREHLDRIEKRFEMIGGRQLPVHVRYLFKHPLLLIENELKFIDELMSALIKNNKEGENQ